MPSDTRIVLIEKVEEEKDLLECLVVWLISMPLIKV